MIARVGPVHVTPSLPRLCQRLEAQLNSKACAAKTVRPGRLARVRNVHVQRTSDRQPGVVPCRDLGRHVRRRVTKLLRKQLSNQFHRRCH